MHYEFQHEQFFVLIILCITKRYLNLQFHLVSNYLV